MGRMGRSSWYCVWTVRMVVKSAKIAEITAVRSLQTGERPHRKAGAAFDSRRVAFRGTLDANNGLLLPT
jgi:hypothetical protein